ncbi:MAG: metallophosphoesterase [Dehalococcoidia bacterium]
MLIAFIGDVHGRMFHAIAAVATLQSKLDTPFDLIIQVGDLGYPNPERADVSTKRYLAVDPAEGDLQRFLEAHGTRAAALRRIRGLLGRPIFFVRGNHEDFAWLAWLAVDPATNTACTDPFDLLHYVPDGTVLDAGGFRVAFLGGVEELPGEAGIDQAAYQLLMELEPDSVDLLITHQGPYGSGNRFGGEVAGSPLISKLLERLEPRFHVFGHLHQLVGPRAFGRTTYLGLDGLVASAIWHPEAGGLKSGCLGILNTEKGELWPVTEDWLGEFPTPFDFDRWAETI